MAATVEEFRELLNADESNLVDVVEKLRDSARHGIPDEVRADVWKYLLLGAQSLDQENVEPLDGSSNGSTDGQDDSLLLYDDHRQSVKRLRGELQRFRRKFSTLLAQHQWIFPVIERVVFTFINRHRQLADTFSPAIIYMCCPFAVALRNEADVYRSFEALMGLLETVYSQDESRTMNTTVDATMNNHNTATTLVSGGGRRRRSRNIRERVAHFMTLVRLTIPDLYNYFQEEEMDCTDWATSWIQFLLSREMPLENLLRLYDCYFSLASPDDMLDFHPYICLAVLKHCKDQLEELEHSEIQSFLCRLPALDMDAIIQSAFNIRHEFQSDYGEL